MIARMIKAAREAGEILTLVSKEEREMRLSKCMECPLLIKATVQCSKCKCFMKAKTWLKYDPVEQAKKMTKELQPVSCPISKW